MKKINMISICVGTFLIVILLGGFSKGTDKIIDLIEPKGFTFEAKKGDKTVYLIADIELAPKSTFFLTDKIKEIIDKTDVLAMDIDGSNPEIMKAVKAINNEKYFVEEDGLKEFFADEELEKLDGLLERFGTHYNMVDYLTPAGLIITLNNEVYNKAEHMNDGLSTVLSDKYKELGSEVISFETVEELFEIMDVIQSDQTMKELLNTYEEDDISLENEVKKLKEDFQAFVNGDEAKIMEKVQTIKDESEVYEKVMIERSKNFVTKINELLERGKKPAVILSAYCLAKVVCLIY
ncbi:MAG: TraB/GumN family protein [Sarcina sp.]